MRLLVAEDDPGMRSVLERGLRRHGYAVDSTARGDDALDLLATADYAAAILDWRMPGLPGVDVVSAVRRRGLRTPVLMLTARDTTSDRVEGLDAGADDYLVKPFDFDELLARLRALLRRPAGAPPLLVTGGLTLDPATREVLGGGSPLALTPRELAILEVLMRRSPATVSKSAIAHHAWDEGEEPPNDNAIEVHVARLRSKVASAGVQIVAVRLAGYRLVTA